MRFRIPCLTPSIASATNASYNQPLPWVPLWQTNSVDGVYTVKVWNPVGTNQSAAWTVRVISPLKPGSTVAWGNNASHQTEYPIDLTNTLAIAAGRAHGVSLQEDGHVRVWGDNTYGQTNVPFNLSNVVAIAAGDDHTLAVNTNGNVIAWGRNTFNQTNVPSTLTNAVAVSAGGSQSLALRKDSTVVQWGQTFVSIPSGLSNVTAIASGTNFHLALRSNSTVVAWGLNNFGQTNVPAGLSNVVAIAAGGFHALALKRDGSVTNWGLNTSGQCNVPIGLSNVMAVAAGWAYSAALKNDGTVVCWGDNTYGQTNVPGLLNLVKMIAAGGNHALAGVFSPLVQYPVDVTKDLLLIFNTNSVNSRVVKDYYLAHRPMVSGANVLGVNCSTNEIISHQDATNQILAPYLNWLSANPTKHPQYIILFPDLPTRIWGNVTNGSTISNSVAFAIHTNASGIRPFVNSINMGLDYLGAGALTNDCIAYINRLEAFGTNYAPGKLLICASATGYSNTNFVLDNIRHGSGWPFPEPDYSGLGGTVSALTNLILDFGDAGLRYTYNEGVEIFGQPAQPHITNALDVAGYICWGGHSSLGNEYPVNEQVKWSGHSSWWVIETIESFNGQRATGQGNFTQWFSPYAFGGTNYSNTPIGAVSHTDEPGFYGINDAQLYFGLWARGKTFSVCAWNSRVTPKFQAVGDPFVRR